MGVGRSHDDGGDDGDEDYTPVWRESGVKFLVQGAVLHPPGANNLSSD